MRRRGSPVSCGGAQPRQRGAAPEPAAANGTRQPVFEVCDENIKGCLSLFKVAVVMLFGYRPSKVHVFISYVLKIQHVWMTRWEHSTGILLKKILDFMSTKKVVQLFSNEIKHIVSAFDMQGRRFLTLEDFKKAFHSVSPKLSERIVVEAFREVDQDSDGHVSFKEFESAMNKMKYQHCTLPKAENIVDTNLQLSLNEESGCMHFSKIREFSKSCEEV
ncbi:PREDICTED: EF-hand calcium-binding domain-containing protein 11 [Tinamus guttatus]|uniref:EF-hand calcium-binding domain-containing protein 11 n=1 Tax=Tinamus guttatus TaxID=94827 RepID=UPI00052ED95F|nr:PREDICTED: EF-hand calcium-binding domain-containing protein 11 [Tinamus guttatus]